MRAAPRLAPLAGLTLCAHLTSACALPEASVADTVSVPAALAQPVSVASGAAAVRAASGTPGQRHLFHAGSWGLLHIHDVQTMALAAPSSAGPFTDVTPASPYPEFPFASQPGGTPDGRTLGVDVGSGDPAQIELGLSSLANASTSKVHLSGTFKAPATLTLKNAPASAPVLSAYDADGTTPDGVVTALGPDDKVLDFGRVEPMLATGLPIETAGFLLDGAGATPRFANLDPKASKVSTRAVLSFGAAVLAIWQDGLGGLKSNVWPVSQVSPGLETDLTESATFDDRTWAACATTGATPVAHVVWASGGNLTHATLDTATPSTWNTAPAGIPAFPGQTVQELFLACGASHVFAFVVLDAASAGAAGQDVLLAVLDVTSGNWSPFSTVVAAQSGVVPCYLSGFDRVVSDGGQQEIGLLWAGGAASDTGCVGTSSALYTAIVPLPSSPEAY
jgi:hypothetical protein